MSTELEIKAQLGALPGAVRLGDGGAALCDLVLKGGVGHLQVLLKALVSSSAFCDVLRLLCERSYSRSVTHAVVLFWAIVCLGQAGELLRDLRVLLSGVANAIQSGLHLGPACVAAEVVVSAHRAFEPDEEKIFGLNNKISNIIK